MPMFELSTSRLRIIPLTLPLLKLCRQGRSSMEKELGLIPTEPIGMSPEVAEKLSLALEEMISSVSSDPKNFYWYTNWEIVYSNRIIGGVAFYGKPDNGVVEVGYAIQPEFQNHGFCREALKALYDWAFKNGAHRIEACVELQNLPSSKVCLSLGMQCIEFNGELKYFIERGY